MNFQQCIDVLEAGEGLKVEFKRKVSTPEKIAKEMIAFANTSGGIILFGIDDDRSIVGVESEKGEMEFIEQAATWHCSPPIEHEVRIFSHRGLDILCVEIPESTCKPHFLVGVDDSEQKSYVRIGEKSMQASREMIKVMTLLSGKTGPVRIIVGAAEKRLFEYLEHHERITVREYAELINISERRASRLLVRLVRAGALAIHTAEKSDYFTVIQNPL